MLTDKRQFRRFDIPLFIDFKSAKRALTYSKGVTRDLSYDGFSFESASSRFKLQENLKFNFTFPQRGTVVSILGNVIWKRKDKNKYLAGVKLGAMDEKTKREIFEKICVYGDIPADRFFPVNEPAGTDTDRPVKISGGGTKGVTKLIRSFLTRSGDTGIKKQYLKSRPVCRVTFRLPKDAAKDARVVTIAGDFNNWDITGSPMKRMKNGDFTITLELPRGKEYRFRYLIDGGRWENDWNADRYIQNPYGCDDSVVIV